VNAVALGFIHHHLMPWAGMLPKLRDVCEYSRILASGFGSTCGLPVGQPIIELWSEFTHFMPLRQGDCSFLREVLASPWLQHSLYCPAPTRALL
jgi:hypothetical protein